MMRFSLVCLGSALGGGLRYLVALWTPRVLGTAFPYGTLIVNVVGCFLILRPRAEISWRSSS